MSRGVPRGSPFVHCFALFLIVYCLLFVFTICRLLPWPSGSPTVTLQYYLLSLFLVLVRWRGERGGRLEQMGRCGLG